MRPLLPHDTGLWAGCLPKNEGGCTGVVPDVRDGICGLKTVRAVSFVGRLIADDSNREPPDSEHIMVDIECKLSRSGLQEYRWPRRNGRTLATDVDVDPAKTDNTF
jgi:hypothetical protein